jgi:hypothetical protein
MNETKQLAHNTATRRWRETNKEYQAQLSKRWAKLYPEKVLEYSKKFRANNHQRALLLDRAAKRRTKDFINSLKNAPCIDCGILHPPYVMDFDHRDGSKKEFNISNPQTTNRDKILEEVKKCDLVCANCHRIRTYTRLKGKI